MIKTILFETEKDSDGKAKQYEISADPKIFSTGSHGFYAGGKITVDGKRYQVSCNLVEVGTKGQF